MSEDPGNDKDRVINEQKKEIDRLSLALQEKERSCACLQLQAQNARQDYETLQDKIRELAARMQLKANRE